MHRLHIVTIRLSCPLPVHTISYRLRWSSMVAHVASQPRASPGSSKPDAALPQLAGHAQQAMGAAPRRASRRSRASAAVPVGGLLHRRRAVGARGAGLGGRRPGPRRHPPARHQDGGPRPHDRARPWPGGPARGGTRGPPPRAGAGRLEQRPARSRCSVRPRRHPKGQPAQLPPHLRELAGAAGRRSVRRGQADGARIHRWFSGTTGTSARRTTATRSPCSPASRASPRSLH